MVGLILNNSMVIYYGTCIFILGLLIGSFLNVLIYRLPRHESFVMSSSHCTNCGNPIKWYDLIPVISYIILRGKCRNCKSKISIQYPVIELLNAVLYLTIYVFLKLKLITIPLYIAVSAVIVFTMIKLQNNKK